MRAVHFTVILMHCSKTPKIPNGAKKKQKKKKSLKNSRTLWTYKERGTFLTGDDEYFRGPSRQLAKIGSDALIARVYSLCVALFFFYCVSWTVDQKRALVFKKATSLQLASVREKKRINIYWSPVIFALDQKPKERKRKRNRERERRHHF